MQDTAPRASLASLFAPPDDDDAAPAAGGAGVTSDAEEQRPGGDPSDGPQADFMERRSGVGPRVSILGPLPDIPRWATQTQFASANAALRFGRGLNTTELTEAHLWSANIC